MRRVRFERTVPDPDRVVLRAELDTEGITIHLQHEFASVEAMRTVGRVLRQHAHAGRHVALDPQRRPEVPTWRGRFPLGPEATRATVRIALLIACRRLTKRYLREDETDD